jgi:GT2 family glycosyltransferase
MNSAVSFLIVSFNSEKYIANCLKSVLQQSESSEIIVIDNNSTDNTVSILQDLKKNPQVKLMLNKTNLGYGNALTAAIKEAKGDCIAILNADVVLDKNWANNILRMFSTDEKIMLVHGKILLPNGEIQSTGGIMDKYGAVIQRGSDIFKKCNIPYNQSYFYSDGSSFMIKKRIFDEIYFDPKIFLYYEDVDLSWKIRMLNYEIQYSEDAVSYHDVGHSDSNMDLAKFYHITKNRIYVCLKNYSKKNILTRIPIMIFLVFLNSLYHDMSKKPTGYTKTFFKALWWNITNIGNTAQENRKLRSTSKISDHDLDAYLLNKSIELNLVRKRR